MAAFRTTSIIFLLVYEKLLDSKYPWKLGNWIFCAINNARSVTIATEGEPSDLVKVLHLLVLSSSWGMQIWLVFIAGSALVWQVTRRTSGQVNRDDKDITVYFYRLLGSHFISLAIYAGYHPWELLDAHATVQLVLYFVALIMAGVNTQCFGPASEALFQICRHDQDDMSSQKEGYTKLKKHYPKTRAFKKFRCYFVLFRCCNLIGLICNTINLIYTALNLSTI
ncbi:transmembrane protein 205 isoform X1 [Dunckerocampus dactyliophorus]|uniref:transmembrane protein 205 isoform X1 n=1 Tax=Dunckerocampus dactyliophorus TaxID=161453 RepID=UPI0024054AE5|nr:transmembrane protein 205 isoform X1 [Dunckerocampus dactyliophorus]